jgi:hypothetical protein
MASIAMVTGFTVPPSRTGGWIARDGLLVASLNYLLATVKTVRRHVVTTMHFTSRGVSGQSCRAQSIV